MHQCDQQRSAQIYNGQQEIVSWETTALNTSLGLFFSSYVISKNHIFKKYNTKKYNWPLFTQTHLSIKGKLLTHISACCALSQKSPCSFITVYFFEAFEVILLLFIHSESSLLSLTNLIFSHQGLAYSDFSFWYHCIFFFFFSFVEEFPWTGRKQGSKANIRGFNEAAFVAAPEELTSGPPACRNPPWTPLSFPNPHSQCLLKGWTELVVTRTHQRALWHIIGHKNVEN